MSDLLSNLESSRARTTYGVTVTLYEHRVQVVAKLQNISPKEVEMRITKRANEVFEATQNNDRNQILNQ